MAMFIDEIRKYGWSDTTDRIMAKTDADVRRALSRKRCDIEDFMAMISPAADTYLEQMARLSRMYTRERFGNTINLFIPIYLTNSCQFVCVLWFPYAEPDGPYHSHRG
jgi:2-iminoacetate synthase